MTEELKQKAYNFINNKICDSGDYSCGYLPSTVEEMLIEFATEATKELLEQIENMKSDVKEMAEQSNKNGDMLALKRMNELFEKWEIKEK